jgi:dolichol-phosphate mannosyltransferase
MAAPLVGAPSLSIVIPTRNEAENVEALIAAICAAIPGSDKELIFVDDSDDATPLLLQRFLPKADCPGLVVQRTGEERAGGLSTAVVAGFASSSGAYLCVMDADLQHPASLIPLLWREAEREQADIVVGSRFMANGSSNGGLDGLQRHAVSRGARFLAHLFLPPARATSDPLSGFFLVHRRVVEDVDLRPVGYKILLEILVRGRWQKVLDAPYAFRARHAGLSKATTSQGVEFARHLASLVVAVHFGKREILSRTPVSIEDVRPSQQEAEAANARRSLSA